MFVTRNGVLLEKEFLRKEKNGQKVYHEEVQDEPVRNDSMSDANIAEQVETPVVLETPPQPRRSAGLHELHGELLLLDDDEPGNYAEAMMDLDSEKWQRAMRSKIGSMRDNQVCNLVHPPDGVRPIECKWIYKRKNDMNRNVHVYKA